MVYKIHNNIFFSDGQSPLKTKNEKMEEHYSR